MTFIVKETQVCYVTWTHIVNAATAEEAHDRFINGEVSSVCPPEIGDSLGDWNQSTLVIEEYEGGKECTTVF